MPGVSSFTYSCPGLIPDTEIYYMYPYHPRHGGCNPEFTQFDNFLLRFKDGIGSAINYFYNALEKQFDDEVSKTIKDYYCFCAVPSSQKETICSSIQKVASMLSRKFGTFDCARSLVRHSSIQKLALGGDRHPRVHLGSIIVDRRYFLKGKNYILLDDITTTGASLASCCKLLLDAGAGAVICLAIGRTV